MTKTELDKWAEVHADVVVIEEFLTWLAERNPPLVLASMLKDSELLVFAGKGHRELTEEYFNINAYKLEMERRALLKEASQ